MSAPASAAPQSDPRRDNSRVIRSPTGPDLHTENWQIEAVYRMMRNNLDPDVAEKPEELVVYGGIGCAARNWQCFDQIQTALTGLKADETLLVQSGKAVGVFRTDDDRKST